MGELDRLSEMPAVVLLPETVQGAGLLHSVASEESGNLYYTDEINHLIVSLDSRGFLRWTQGGKGAEPGRFRYPRGLALGRIRLGGAERRCVAVSDAWNGRIQFLDLDGAFLAMWSEAGGNALSEPSDIRFIEPEAAPGSGESYWLVLDRGNHRLCALDESGSLLFTIGRGLPPGLRDRWMEPQILSAGDFAAEDNIPEYTPYDGLYYPERILGRTEACLCLWEPYSRNLLHIVDRNALPLPLGTFPDRVWIAADLTGVVEWSRDRSSLRWHGPDGALLCEQAISGRPVPSNLPSACVWIQEGRTLSRISRGAIPSDSRTAGADALLLHAAACAMGSFDSRQAQESVESLLLPMREMVAFGALASGIDDVATGPVTGLPERETKLAEFVEGFRQGSFAIADALHPLCLAALELRLVATSKAGDCFETTFSPWRAAAQPIVSKLYREFLDVVEASDELELRLALASGPGSGENRARSQLIGFLERLRNALLACRSWLYPWCAPASSHSTKAIDHSLAGPPPLRAGLLARSGRTGRPRKFQFVTEIDRIRFEGAPAPDLAGPLYLTPSPEGGLFVSFYSSGHVAELTCAGRFVRVLGIQHGSGKFECPAGLAVDERQRLWVAESAAGRIRILEPPYDGPGAFVTSSSEGLVLGWPVGLCAWHDAMLAADPRKNRVMRIGLDGRWEVPLSRAGHGPGEIRFPNTLCRDRSAEAAIWVVDKFNHRLQRFDKDWRVTRWVGQCGLGKGELIYPLALDIFPDGTLVVSQGGPPAALKLINPSGEEIETLFLDYSPAGVLIRDGRIHVAAFDDNAVRIYERN